MKNHWSFLSWCTCIAVIIGVAFAYPRWQKETVNATLSWDVMGYYLYLPAFFIYEDAKQLEFKDDIIKKYQPTVDFYQAYRDEDKGNYVMKYAIGQAVLYSPFFAIAHIHASVSEYPTDGFSYPYQFWISWGSMLVAFCGLWWSRLTLLRYFSDKATAISLLLIAAGTNYLNYTAIDHAMTHNYQFMLYALMIWATIRFYEKTTLSYAALIGVILGLACLTRPTELVMVLIPLLWGMKSFKKRGAFLQKHWTKVLIAITITLAIGSLQLFYWHYATGDWIVYSYQDQGFSWLSPHFDKGILSYQKGWLTYTPLMLFSLIGFYFLYHKQQTIFWACFIFFIINIYIVLSWDVWWYGGSLGQRAMVQSYAILLFPLAAFVQKIYQSQWWKQLIISGLFVFCIWYNGILTYQAHGGGLAADGMTRAYFWRLFGNLHITDADKKLLDTNEDYQGERQQVRQLFFENFDQQPDTLSSLSKKIAHSGDYSIVVWRDRKLSNKFVFPITNISEKWLRVSAMFYAPYKEWDTWKMCQFTVKFKKGEEVIKRRMVRVFRTYNQGKWDEVFIDIKVPKDDFDSISVHLNNAGSDKEVFMDDLRLEAFTEE